MKRVIQLLIVGAILGSMHLAKADDCWCRYEPLSRNVAFLNGTWDDQSGACLNAKMVSFYYYYDTNEYLRLLDNPYIHVFGSSSCPR